MEAGLVDGLLDDPKHPYTQALIAAIPDPARRGEQRIRLEGTPQSPIDPDPNTCRFHGRCPASSDRCVTAAPLLRRLGDAHFAACHFA
jgi:oligopeptide/dipeptide ABC transporter ATP-binding protein